MSGTAGEVSPHDGAVANAPVRRRLRQKTSAVARLGPEAVEIARNAHVDAALAEVSGEALLQAGVKRKNINWTHVRTFNPAWVQPEQLSKQQFWEHLEKLYADQACTRVTRSQGPLPARARGVRTRCACASCALAARAPCVPAARAHFSRAAFAHTRNQGVHAVR